MQVLDEGDLAIHDGQKQRRQMTNLVCALQQSEVGTKIRQLRLSFFIWLLIVFPVADARDDRFHGLFLTIMAILFQRIVSCLSHSQFTLQD